MGMISEQRPTYNLRAVTRETGLSPETLRAWERRYGIVNPQRTAGGHRLYTLRDIRLLKWLVAQQKQGLSISRAVELWRTLQESGQDPLAIAGTEALTRTGTSNLDELRQAWVAASLDFNEQAAEQILSEAFAVAAPEIVVIEVLQKGVTEIGGLWYEGQASVQQEHFASSLATRRLHSLLAAAPPVSRSGRILAACPPGEEHEFALLMITSLLRRQGWEVVYLGANVPLLKLEATLHATSPILVLSLAQTLPAAASLREMADLVKSLDVPLAFGGRIFTKLPDLVARIPGHYLGEDISVVPKRLDEIIQKNERMPPAEPLPDEYQHTLEFFLDKQHAIEAVVSEEIKAWDLPATAMDQANQALPAHLKAALALGDINTMVYSLDWVEGLLENYGMSPDYLKQYLKVYRHAIQEQLDGQADLITEALQLDQVGED
jgi:MerR family transcriptional regulator, light-induced transcriptional regulator